MDQTRAIQIIAAPSILGLKPTGVEELPASLLSQGLYAKLKCQLAVITVPTRNSSYRFHRDATGCLNSENIRIFSEYLSEAISTACEERTFALVLGGDCSILLGILPALKAKGDYGLLFCDAHADFYAPGKSITGEVADMDLAVVTGRGPDILTNINGLKPYVSDQQIIHIGQRDWQETIKYGSEDIRTTAIKCFDYEDIKKNGIQLTLTAVLAEMESMQVQGFWLHFDTDVLADEENPAVDYRIPYGLSFLESEQLLKGLFSVNKIIGMSVTIFNPRLDNAEGIVAQKLCNLLINSIPH